MLLLLVLLPAFVLAKINVDFTLADSEAHAAVKLDGIDIDTISDKEIESFKLKGQQLKDALMKYNKVTPTDAYLKKPAGPHRLYDTYGWYEVQRVLLPISSRVLRVKTEPTIVAHERFTNRFQRNATFNAAISETLENTASTSWSNSQAISFSNQINYGVSVKAIEIGGSFSYGFEAGWGKEETKSQTVSVGVTTGVTVTLEGGEIVEARLVATRGHMEVEVEYVAYLQGDVAVNYADKYKGHHFYRFDIGTVMLAADLPEEVKVKETVKLGFYANADVQLIDIKSNEKKVDQPVPITKGESEAERIARRKQQEQAHNG